MFLITHCEETDDAETEENGITFNHENKYYCQDPVTV